MRTSLNQKEHARTEICGECKDTEKVYCAPCGKTWFSEKELNSLGGEMKNRCIDILIKQRNRAMIGSPAYFVLDEAVESMKLLKFI